jgi:glycosyltransferase involved in cell wall biosynthesis
VLKEGKTQKNNRVASNYYVVVPVFNEQKNIKFFLSELKKHTDNIIVVDDGSNDKTPKLVSKFPGIDFIKLKSNQGKGSAMKLGANHAWKLKAKGVIFMDGDNQHDPKHIQEFINQLENSHDVVIGIRVVKNQIPFTRRLGNNIFMHFMKIMFDVNIPDILCGYRAFTEKGYKSVLWDSSGYGVETEILTLIGRKKIPYQTVIVDTIYFDRYKGFSIKSGLKILSKLPYWRIRKIN